MIFVGEDGLVGGVLYSSGIELACAFRINGGKAYQSLSTSERLK